MSENVNYSSKRQPEPLFSAENNKCYGQHHKAYLCFYGKKILFLPKRKQYIITQSKIIHNMNIKHSAASAAYLILAFMAIWLAPTETKAQVTYETFIYTSDALSSEIQDLSNERAARGGYMADLGMAMANAGKGIAGGYVTSFIDMGVNAIASLITRPSRLKNEWEETVKAESTFETKFGTVSELNDFYSVPSTDGAMDPRGMRFNGIGCLRRGEKGDTVFYISCHVDHSKLYRIVNHSKFELVLDTLILCPKESNLPNSSLPLPFYFSERGSYQIDMTMTLTSSWINELTVLQKDKELGRFELTVPIDSSQVAADGKYRYVRGRSKGSPLVIKGESFIVPRSFMAYRDENDQYHNSWGTGEYKMSVTLKESCDVTDEYRDEWRNDRKRRKKLTPKEGWTDNVWKVIESQKWDEISKQWVITTLSAPADMITGDIIDKLDLAPDK